LFKFACHFRRGSSRGANLFKRNSKTSNCYNLIVAVSILIGLTSLLLYLRFDNNQSLLNSKLYNYNISRRAQYEKSSSGQNLRLNTVLNKTSTHLFNKQNKGILKVINKFDNYKKPGLVFHHSRKFNFIVYFNNLNKIIPPIIILSSMVIPLIKSSIIWDSMKC
jgi:hypothetical protein